MAASLAECPILEWMRAENAMAGHAYACSLTVSAPAAEVHDRDKQRPDIGTRTEWQRRPIT
jgi:hypothetical protein